MSVAFGVLLNDCAVRDTTLVKTCQLALATKNPLECLIFFMSTHGNSETLSKQVMAAIEQFDQNPRYLLSPQKSLLPNEPI